MEPVGIYSSVTITRPQLERFYAERGNALVDDVRCIFGNKPRLKPDKYGCGFYDPETEYFHNSRNKLVVRYDEPTEKLFYLYQLEVQDLESMVHAPSFQVFTDIAKYHKQTGEDYIAFSPSAPNFMLDQLWRVYSFTHDGLKEIPVEEFSKERQSALDRLAWKYYWGPIEAMFQRSDRGEDISYFEHFFPRYCLDSALLGLLGITIPPADPRMVPPPYKKD